MGLGGRAGCGWHGHQAWGQLCVTAHRARGSSLHGQLQREEEKEFLLAFLLEVACVLSGARFSLPATFWYNKS